MEKRETVIRQWFDMWLKKADLGIADIFSDAVVYIESWGPEYHGVEKVKLWFDEWNTRGTVLQWNIKQFFHIAHIMLCFPDSMILLLFFRRLQQNGPTGTYRFCHRRLLRSKTRKHGGNAVMAMNGIRSYQQDPEGVNAHIAVGSLP